MSFSALQRAEIAEILIAGAMAALHAGFSALQRAEIAEIKIAVIEGALNSGFSALQRAEIAEILSGGEYVDIVLPLFQCSSTSRNC